MKFVDLMRGWFGSWLGWFRMVLSEGIARDVQQRQARLSERRQQRWAHQARQPRSRGRHSSSQQQQQQLQGHAQQPVAGGEAAAGRLGSTRRTVCGAVQNSDRVAADSHPQRLPSRTPSVGLLSPPAAHPYVPAPSCRDGRRAA